MIAHSVYINAHTDEAVNGQSNNRGMRSNDNHFVKATFSVPGKQVYHFIVWLLAFSHFQAGLQSNNDYENEKSIMLDLKQLWGNRSTSVFWNSSSSHCNWFGVDCTNGSVTGITLGKTQISGKIPPVICGLHNLEEIDLADNKLIGEFPTCLYNCSNLKVVDLSWNQFHGPLPSDIHRLSKLVELDITGNNFNQIPGAIGQLSELLHLYLKFNSFNSVIPREIGNLSKLVALDISFIESFTQATIPEEIGRLNNLEYLSVAGSNLIGGIPETFSALSSLQTLDLSGNHLNGSVPGYLFHLKKLTALHLQFNQFSGSLPSIGGNLSLRTLDLSSNQLSGHVPHEYDKSNYFFGDNLNLCTTYPNRYIEVPRCSHKTKVVIIVVAPIAVLLIVALLCCILKKNLNFSAHRLMWSRKKHENQDPEWMFISFQRLKFTESQVLANMTEDNVIGSGGSGKVYRVCPNPNGNFVAAKKIWNKKNLDQKLEKQFLAEVEVLGRIRHSNIVKLLCYISSGNTKILVYEYMKNQSLDDWLHRKRSSSAHCVLGWHTRLQIAVGAARGLCYMHHECSPPIVHRDIKSCNILLDDELNAKIADFGLAKVLAKWGETETASVVAGTLGYLAPEYAYTSKVNIKSDVYSFGVVLLELVTGRKPIYRDDHMNLAQWAWKFHEEGYPIVDAFDEEIKEERFSKEISSMFNLGLICTSTVPSARLSMKDVLNILLLISTTQQIDVNPNMQ